MNPLTDIEEQHQLLQGRVSQVYHIEERVFNNKLKGTLFICAACASIYQFFVLQLNAEIADFDEAREKESPLLQEAEAKVKELRQTIEGLNNEQVKVRTSLKKLKEKSGEMDKEVRLFSAMTNFISFT